MGCEGGGRVHGARNLQRRARGKNQKMRERERFKRSAGRRGGKRKTSSAKAILNFKKIKTAWLV